MYLVATTFERVLNVTTKANPVIDNFIVQYKAMQPRSSKEYNKRRTPGSPQWDTVARACGLTRWLDLLDHCGLERPARVYPTGRQGPKRELIVHRHSDYEEYMKYLDSEEYWYSLGEDVPFVPRLTNT